MCLLHAGYKGHDSVAPKCMISEVICSLCWEETKNHPPEDVSQLEGGDGSPVTAEEGDKMWLCQKPTVTSTVWEQRVMDVPESVAEK